jgi:ABC-type lipoprotein export system ATPase subunit
MSRQGPPRDDDRWLLELEDVKVVYPARNQSGAVSLFDGLRLGVRPAELAVVAGRSGSGKTTLLNVAAGLRRPSSGFVRWSGSRIDSLSRDGIAAERGRFIGLVFQNAGLIDTLTTSENAALAGVSTGVKRDRSFILALLDSVGLADRANHFPAQLSGGEQQRAALARALFADPPLLVVDEPTANLDRRTADEIIHRLVDLRASNRGLLVASHDPHLIEVADTLVELERD